MFINKKSSKKTKEMGVIFESFRRRQDFEESTPNLT